MAWVITHGVIKHGVIKYGVIKHGVFSLYVLSLQCMFYYSSPFHILSYDDVSQNDHLNLRGTDLERKKKLLHNSIIYM